MNPRVVVVYAHPCADSFIATARQRVVDGLIATGCDVTTLDLYREGYDPPMPASEPHLAACREADALVIVYPTWFGAQPAILTGWLQAVASTGERFDRIANLVVVTSHGSTRLPNRLSGRPGYHVLGRFLKRHCALRARRHWLALYGHDKIDDAERRLYLDSIPAGVCRALGIEPPRRPMVVEAPITRA